MTIDVTTNAQYVSLKQSYDQQIARDQQISDQVDKLNTLNAKLKTLDTHSVQYAEVSKQIKLLTDSLEQLDPGGSIRTRLNNNTESIPMLKDQEAAALKSLSVVLVGQDALDQADAAAKQATGGVTHSSADIMTEVMMTFAMLGEADEKVIASQMDTISGNVDKITQLNTLSETVRDARPGGTNSDATGSLSAAVVDKLKSLGVQMPAGITQGSDGNYSIKQSDFDTVINNIQSTQSSLTTLNQNKTIDLNKAVDIRQQCTTFESTALEKNDQLLQKLVSA